MSEDLNTPRPRPEDATEASRIYLLPNSLTAGNLFFGFLAILRCIQANNSVDSAQIAQYFTQAVWFILLAIICDALDGRVARIGNRESLFGKEFDSIADVVSFGVAPALMTLFLILAPTEKYPFFLQTGWLIAFIYLLCAGIRLARFNVLTHPLLDPPKAMVESDDFIGLPVPAAAGMIASLVLVLNTFDLRAWALLLPPLLLAISVLMVSNIAYPSFKTVTWQTRTPFHTFIVIVIAIGVAFTFREFFFALLFLCYIAYGPARALYRKPLKKN
ncbi:MAG: CDP-diacylglycerol--serine O-phosphatidyltransferase [Verrucomicrobia bacterium]|nr:CDP-diacylglycerol--serine O-phosphatidyltransferase [Verrucomicrobiota bacterium]